MYLRQKKSLKSISLCKCKEKCWGGKTNSNKNDFLYNLFLKTSYGVLKNFVSLKELKSATSIAVAIVGRP